jgi:hypothetical protein
MRKYGLIKLGLAAVMLISASAASEGADVSAGPAYPPPPPLIPFVYNWTGFYAGAHAGVGWSDGGSSGSSALSVEVRSGSITKSINGCWASKEISRGRP